VAEREASGDFDYLFEDPTDDDRLTGHAPASDPEAPEDLADQFSPDDDLWDDPDDNFWDRGPELADDGFDPFGANTWRFAPAPAPWYRTKQALTALIAATAATAAIVVSGVLLIFRTPGTTDDHKATTPPTAPTSAAPATVASSAELPPPPPPETSASSVNTAPDVNYPTVQPRPTTKPPEIGVTRTPATRSPISVAPQPRRPRN
jgi:hypothetical protein